MGDEKRSARVINHGQTRKEALDRRSQILSATKQTKVATKNVKTPHQARKLDQLSKRFKAYGLEILWVSEMRWT